MYRINIRSKNVYIEDVKSSQLGTILKWYNNTNDYAYATGREKATSLTDLWKTYHDFLENPDMFFCVIFRRLDNEPIGLLKGSFLKERKSSLWISILLITTRCQKLGYGSEVISAFTRKVKVEEGIKTMYLSCSRHNVQGMNFWRKIGFSPSEIILENRYKNNLVKDIIIMEMEI